VWKGVELIGSSRVRPGLCLILALLLVPALTGAAPLPTRVDVAVEGLRNKKGVVRVCLTRSASHFPDCNSDPEAESRTLPAREAGRLSFEGLPQGNYALALFHDENSNAKLDTFAKIPREGFAFSRNPKIRLGAPSFDQVVFQVGPGPSKLQLRMQYFL
jgi:uncharacterized protein (DUF2141 family)